MIDLAIESFARQLAEDVNEAVLSEQESPYHEQEFTRIVLERLADEGALENPIPLWQEGTFGRTIYKINGYAIPDDEERLVLIATVYTGEPIPRTLTKDEILKACQQAMKFYECSRKGLHKQIEPANTDASDLARRIYDAKDKIGVLRVIVISDGLTGLRSIDLKDAFDGTRAIVDLFGIERLHRILGEGLTRDDIAIDIEEEYGAAIPCLKAPNNGADYDAYLAILPGSLLADVYEKYGTRLLELNVRAFLGLRGRKSVNANLRQTIREAPKRFLAYNNGIVCTVDSMEVAISESGSPVIKSLRGLQIVNGGQTTASLHRALRQDKADLQDISVPAKIIWVGTAAIDEMVSSVSRSANSQNTVQPADFSANEPFHVAVEALANNVWLPDGSGRWFYERARGSYGAAEMASSARVERSRRFARETPKDRRFSKTDLAKYLNAWRGSPHLVSFGSQKNFQYFMQSMKEEHPDGFLPDPKWYRAFIAKAILFRAVQKITKARKFPAYQANITAYTVAWLSWASNGEIDFDLIWKQQAISTELMALTETWTDKVDVALRESAGNRMPSEWAKKSDCRDEMRELFPRLSRRPPPEFGATAAAVDRTVASSQT
jgi:hypothetical protein